jgi:lipopolysaccharide biosynthesis glycosyltransferase
MSFELKSLAQRGLANSFEKTFNAGVLWVNLKDNREEVYKDLLNLIDPKAFKSVSSGHTDQYLLNTYFEHKVTWMDASYNYIVREAEFISKKVGISKEQAKLWHYIRNPKPWNFNRLLKNKLKGKENPLHVLEWQREYQDFLRLKKGAKSRFGDQIRMLIFRVLS